MEKAHKKKLQHNRVILVEQMDTDNILDALLQRDIYKPSHHEAFMALAGPAKRNTSILNDIVRRGPKAFYALADSLYEVNQIHLAQLLIPDITQDNLRTPDYYFADITVPCNKAHVQQSVAEGVTAAGESRTTTKSPVQEENIPVKEEEVEPMEHETSRPEVWPVKTMEEVLEMKMSKGNYTSEVTDSPKEIYKMKSKPRGKALIINNKKFRTMPLRKGTEVDARQLQHLFGQLGFDVECKTDLNYLAIKEKLNEYRSMNHSRYDCFIFAILTHGVNGAVYSTDEHLLKIEDIQNCFSGANCKSLTSKPKLFFIQACRGESFDLGVEATDGVAVSPIHVEVAEGDTDAEEALVQKMLRIELDEMDAFGSSLTKLPTHSDMLLAYATVPGYVSWRNSERGSWFVQALTETFLQYADKEDLLSMLTMVNNKVAIAFESSSGRNKQMPAPVSMLRKKLFFVPGYYES